jgi:hypothetical protein
VEVIVLKIEGVAFEYLGEGDDPPPAPTCTGYEVKITGRPPVAGLG